VNGPRRLALATLVAALCGPAAAATDPEPVPGDFVMRDFRFASGETLPELKIHYRTLGSPRLAATRDDTDRFLAEQMATRLSGLDANNLLFALEASRDYDPSKRLERIEKPLLAINFADDAINPPELGILDSLIPKVRSGRYVLIPASGETRGHGTHSLPVIWQEHLRAFLPTLAP
jgi:homoserine O-acetyltransferase